MEKLLAFGECDGLTQSLSIVISCRKSPVPVAYGSRVDQDVQRRNIKNNNQQPPSSSQIVEPTKRMVRSVGRAHDNGMASRFLFTK